MGLAGVCAEKIEKWGENLKLKSVDFWSISI